MVGTVHAKILLEHFGNATDIFHAKKSALEKIEGIGMARARSIKTFANFPGVEKELRFIEKYRIHPLCLTDNKYPRRLLNCYDSPTVLYFKGNTDLNASIVVAFIGTRAHSEYGKHLTEKLIKDLAPFHALVVSGLAFGIDSLAHKMALKNNLPTLGVLGHGLDTMYPPEHAALAREMICNGGILTEFRSQTKPDKHNFPIRNRIVAGMSDAIVVVETGIKGGSMITAELANGYNKDVFAVPGKTTDPKSTGCNELIKKNKAMLLTDTIQLVEVMGWDRKPRDNSLAKKQREMFIQLSALEKNLMTIIKENETVHIDELHLRSKMSSSATAAAILNLELQGLIISIPGKRYTLADPQMQF
ncbi:MAG: DNA-processing protein DprA [Chitinophagales bacterium]